MNRNNLTNTLKSIHSLNIFCIALFFIILIISFLAEKDRNMGAGWDGVYYREVARNFPDMLRASFSDYKATRILPFAIAHYIIKTLHLEPTDEIILITVWVLIIIMMILGVIFYYKIGILLNWRPDLTLMGFIILFFNFAILKYTGFCPIMTDHFIFPLTIIILYYFLKKNYLKLLLLGFASCFIWPTYILIIPLLLLSNPVIKIGHQQNPIHRYERFWKLIKLGIPLFPLIVYIYIIRSNNIWIEKRFLNAPMYWGYRPYNFSTLIISQIAVYIYYLLLIWPVNLNMTNKFIISLFQTKQKQIIYTFIFIFSVYTLKYFLTIGYTEPPFPQFKDLVFELIFRPTVAPFNFIIYAFWFHGVIVFLIIRFYRLIINNILEIGNSYFLIVAYSLILLTSAQSRWLTAMLPFFIIVLMPILHKTIINRVSIKNLITLIIISLLVSRFWYPFEGFWFLLDEEKLKNSGYWEKHPLFIGWWISDYHYLWLTAIGIILYFLWNRYWLNNTLERRKI
jgi:hypothetical protein